jgi:hypothetical protein
MNELKRLEQLTRVTLEAHAASERFCIQQLAKEQENERALYSIYLKRLRDRFRQTLVGDSELQMMLIELIDCVAHLEKRLSFQEAWVKDLQEKDL